MDEPKPEASTPRSSQARANLIRRSFPFPDTSKMTMLVTTRFGINPDARNLRQSFGQTARVLVIYVQTLRRFFERDERRRRPALRPAAFLRPEVFASDAPLR